MNRKDLKTLALTRLREAKVLLANGEYSGAYYLAGYVVECALKACIAKQTRIHDFPDKQRALDSWNHDPTKLIHTADLQTERNREISADERFEENWNVVKDWSEQSRCSQTDQKTAEALIQAISDRGHGVLRWLKRHW